MVKKEKIATHTYKAVNYVGLIPVLTQAIKEQQVELDALKAENEVLKKENMEFKKEMEAKWKLFEARLMKK